MYEELIELIKRNRQAKGGNLSKFLNYFLFAACYKSVSNRFDVKLLYLFSLFYLFINFMFSEFAKPFQLCFGHLEYL